MSVVKTILQQKLLLPAKRIILTLMKPYGVRTDLTSVVFTDSTLETEEYAFYSCEDLKSITICENAKSDTEIKIDFIYLLKKD